MVACTVILGHACPGFLSGTRGSLGTATEVNFRDPPAQSRNNYRMSRSASFLAACGLQLFWMRQFLRNRDVPKQLQTSGWFPKPRVTRPLASRLASRWRHLGVTFSSGRLRIAVVLDAPISSKSRCSKTTPNLRLVSETPCH